MGLTAWGMLWRVTWGALRKSLLPLLDRCTFKLQPLLFQPYRKRHGVSNPQHRSHPHG
jgi:hypothetical protein